MDASTNTIIAGEYGVSEFSIPQLRAFLQPLKRRGLTPVSCTIDGNPQLYKVLKILWPDVIIQRCLVHIQRQGLSWCRRPPKRTDAKHLRNLFKDVCSIDSLQKQEQFMSQLMQFENRFGIDIAIQPEKGWVFSDIKRARSMLVKAVPNMFHYLNDVNIPKTTNALEGYYSRLKERYRQHRGLTRDKLHTYFNWYFYLKPM
jgi:transposase-like protein